MNTKEKKIFWTGFFIGWTLMAVIVIILLNNGII